MLRGNIEGTVLGPAVDDEYDLEVLEGLFVQIPDDAVDVIGPVQYGYDDADFGDRVPSVSNVSDSLVKWFSMRDSGFARNRIVTV